MRSLISLQERLAIAGNEMFRKATLLRRRLRAEQKKAALEAYSLPGGMVIDRVAARSQVLATFPGR
jgi:hypothetical protein